ncbi:MAG: helix-turn-helix domain-containing protein [Candidatus Omnitrophota bacterium]
MSSIGTVLKEARNRKAITLEEVHSRTKIHPRVLQLLEEDKFDKLPSPLFVKSFLKSYAEFLEVNPEEIVLSYEKEKKDPEQALYIKTVTEKKAAQGIPPQLVAGAGVAAVILVSGFLAFALFQAAGGWIAKSQHARPKAVKAAAKPRVEKPQAAKPAEEKAKLSGEWLRSAELGNFPKIPPKTPLELTITAVDNVWLRVTCDGKVLFQSILKKGASETWSANDAVEIWTGNSSNMQLALNRSQLGSPGKGVIRKLVVSRDGVRIAK